jgi:cellulose biosynthesis protein BcsQ
VSRVVTVMNMKGGVGKTTVAIHLGGIAALVPLADIPPQKVLLIDYDPQFNLSQAYLPAKKYFSLEGKKHTTLSVLLEDDVALNPYQLQVPGNLTPPSVKQLATKLWQNPSGGSLDLVPSTLDLMYVALGLSEARTKPIEERFQKFITECRSIYDLIVIDCHPAGSIFTKTSLANSDHVLIPVMPQQYAVRGIGLMMRFIKHKQIGKSIKTHILFNATPRTGGATSQEQTIRANSRYANFCLTHTLKWYRAFREPEGGLGFVWSSGKPYSTEAYWNLRAVGNEFMNRVKA